MPKGSSIGATVGGTVVYADFGKTGSGYGGYGNTVAVKDAFGNIHRYAHMDKINVKVGQKIDRGTIVGTAGSTGRSTGVHLDYGVKNSKGAAVDPTPYLTAKSQPKASGPSSLGGAAGKKVASAGSSYTNTYKTKKDALKAPGYQTYKANLSKAIQTGKVPDSWAVGLTELIGRESTWNSTAQNQKSTAYGYGQLLDANVKKYTKQTGYGYNTPLGQIINTAAYVKERYGTPEKALQHWDKKGWY
jgi:Peptidase family M23